MRRILFTVVASTALFVAAPTVALAHSGERHHHHHHKREHHARVRHETFLGHRHAGDANNNEPTAGTVTLFANDALTITLTNGSTVSGEVTDGTEIKCENPGMHNGDNDGDDNGGDEHGDAVSHHGDGGGDRGDDDANDEMCTPAAGLTVRNAELTINGNGAFWDEVELVNGSSSTTSSQS